MGAERVKRLTTMSESWVRFLGQENPLEKEIATHSSILAPTQRRLVGYSPQGRKELDATKRLHFLFSLSVLQKFIVSAAAKMSQSCPTLCNPRDGSPPGSPSLGFSRQEQWSGLPFPSPMHGSEK